MRILIIMQMLVSSAMAQPAPRAIRPPPAVFLRDRTPEAVVQDEVRAAVLDCARRSKIDPGVLTTPECIKAMEKMEAIARYNDAEDAAHKGKK